MQEVHQDEYEEDVIRDDDDDNNHRVVGQVMLPSIKESDRYTTDDRVELAMKGVLLTIFAIAANIFFWVLGWIVFYLVFLVLLGPVLIAQAMCSTYKGHIKMVVAPRSATCPVSCSAATEPHRPSVEWYQEKSGHGRDAVWISKLYCRWCGYKAERGPRGTVVYASPASSSSAAATRRTGQGLPRPQELPDDPIAKAQAILRASKAKQTSQDGKADYETVPVVEAKIVPSENDSTSTSAATHQQEDDVVELTGRNIV